MLFLKQAYRISPQRNERSYLKNQTNENRPLSRASLMSYDTRTSNSMLTSNNPFLLHRQSQLISGLLQFKLTRDGHILKRSSVSTFSGTTENPYFTGTCWTYQYVRVSAAFEVTAKQSQNKPF